MVTQRFRLDMLPDGSPSFEAYVSQHDVPIHFDVELYAHDGELTIPAGAAACLEGSTASSGTQVSADCTRSGAIVRFDLPASATGEMGRHVMQIVLKYDGKELRSTPFVVCVEGDPILL